VEEPGSGGLGWLQGGRDSFGEGGFDDQKFATTGDLEGVGVVGQYEQRAANGDALDGDIEGARYRRGRLEDVAGW
jgi:hypothetical protein